MDRRGSRPCGSTVPSSRGRSLLYSLGRWRLDGRRLQRVPAAATWQYHPARTGSARHRPASDDRAGPLVRAGRRPPRRGLPALLVHQGHRAGGRLPRRRAGPASRGMRVLDVGCGPGRHAHALGRRGIEVHRRRHQPALRRPRHGRRPARGDLRSGPTPGRSPSTPSSTPPSRSARAPSGSPAARARRSTATGPCSTGMARRCARRACSPCRPSRPTSRLRFLEDQDTFDADAGVNHERTVVKDEDGADAEVDLWTTCFTPRELRLLAARAGLEVRAPLVGHPGGLRGRTRPRSTPRSSSSSPARP